MTMLGFILGLCAIWVDMELRFGGKQGMLPANELRPTAWSDAISAEYRKDVVLC